MNLWAAVHSDSGSGLALAVIASSNAPVLLLNGDRTVMAASDSFYRAFQLDPAGVTDRAIGGLGAGEWAGSQLDELLKATASGAIQTADYEMDLDRKDHTRRHLLLNARKLDYGNGDDARLLLTIADVTEARAADKRKDDMLRDTGILLQELQHRVANSLQIIASVLMQSARRVQSEETRLHLRDAHNRVMSVAAVQQQLTTSSLGGVELRPYFTDLCRSIGASMIRDSDQISLDVSVDGSATSSDVSISLGLIVTELVINALKHAFPEHAGGKIMVDYRADGSAWTLSVSDTGKGMPPRTDESRSGLGATIVDALAKKLDAIVAVSSARPGTRISITHA